MATRSRIGLLLDNDYVLSVYHHWDGYPSGLGVFLQHNYTTKEQIAELLDGGDISSIYSRTDWNNEQVDLIANLLIQADKKNFETESFITAASTVKFSQFP